MGSSCPDSVQFSSRWYLCARKSPYTLQGSIPRESSHHVWSEYVQRIELLLLIMYIYHALINALSAHMIHINLNMIFYTHVKHSPTKPIYIKYYKIKYKIIKTHYKHTHTRARARTHARTHTHTYTDCSRNWVLILVRMEILWEKDGFQFGFKRWQGWAVSNVLWEWIPNVGSKAREGSEAMNLAFVLLDFQHAGVRRRA